MGTMTHYQVCFPPEFAVKEDPQGVNTGGPQASSDIEFFDTVYQRQIHIVIRGAVLFLFLMPR